MKNHNMARFKDKVSNFELLLSKFREGMEQERRVTPENEFAKKYHISTLTLIRLMWLTPEKPTIRWWVKIVMNVEEVNKLRLTMTDKDIAKQLNTYPENINKQCGSRKELGIKVYAPRLKKEVRMKERKEVIWSLWPQEKWTYPDDTEYEKQWKKEAVTMWPCEAFYMKLSA